MPAHRPDSQQNKNRHDKGFLIVVFVLLVVVALILVGSHRHKNNTKTTANITPIVQIQNNRA